MKKTEVKEIEGLVNTKKEPKVGEKRPAGRREQIDLDPEGMEE